MNQNKKSTPREVEGAVTLLLIALGIGVVRSIMAVATFGEIGTPRFYWYVMLLICVLMLFILYMILKGYNWVRIVLIVVFLTDLLFFIRDLWLNLPKDNLSQFLYFLGGIQAGLHLVAILVLFTKPSMEEKVTLSKGFFLGSLLGW